MDLYVWFRQGPIEATTRTPTYVFTKHPAKLCIDWLAIELSSSSRVRARSVSPRHSAGLPLSMPVTGVDIYQYIRVETCQHALSGAEWGL